MKDNIINTNKLEGAGPFYYEGNEIGILLIHGGGGGTCADLKPLAQDLHEKGNFTISVPLLPGFGTRPEDLKQATVKMWKDALNKEYARLKDNCNILIVGGHSLGGIFALLLASEVEVNGIITISTPIAIRGIGVKLAPFLKFFMKYHKIPSDSFREETNGKWIGYDKIPLNIINKLNVVLREMMQILPVISSPILLFQGKKDAQIKKVSMDHIYDKVSSAVKKKVWLENNQHPILDCPDHRQIVDEIIYFIQTFI